MADTAEPTPEQILALPLDPSNDAGAATVRDYLIQLLAEVWRHGEGFSGKRPFGNSGWEYDLYKPLATAGYIEATYDEDGWLELCDDKAGDALIATAITALGAPGEGR